MNLQNATLPATAVIAIVGGFFSAYLWMNNHFALAADVSEQIQQVKAAIADARVQQLEDKIFELQLKDKRTSAEQALLERYQEQLRQLRAAKK